MVLTASFGASDLVGFLGQHLADLLHNLAYGMGVALSFKNLGLCFIGCLIGTLIGVLPGIGPVATLTMLLPITFGLDTVGALIMLAGIYYGAQYGGSTTAILVNIPGEVTSVVTTLDGYQMARQGRAGAALGIAAIGSFFAGCVATVIIAALALPLTNMALKFGYADYFSLIVLGLLFAVVLARGSVMKAVAIILVGILLATVGTDLESTQLRLTFGWLQIADGFDVAVLAMGTFGVTEILRNLETTKSRQLVHGVIGRLLPTGKEMRQSAGPIARGTLLGSVLGLLPGNGAVLGPFASYSLEKKLARDPSRFGNGAIEGVAGPESANNAGAQTAFIPLLTLGIPPNAVMALMVGAMTIHGIQPGPQIISKQPDLFWGMIASMWIGNVMLLIINLPLIGLWVRFLKVPYRLMFPMIVVLCCIGIYSIKNSGVEVYMTAGFGLFGYALIKFGFEPAPLLLGFVLGELMEEKLRQALVLSRGSFLTFLDRPLSATFIVVALLLVVAATLPAMRKSRDEVFQESD
jgi:putative tricarboxylic transport membrane protein